MVARHRCRGRPREVVVQHLLQSAVAGQSDIREGLIEAGNRTAIHFVVLAISAVHFHDAGLVTIGIGIRAGAAERLGPVGGKPLHMLGVEAVAECMGNHFVSHHPAVPGGCKQAQAGIAARCLKDSFHVSMMTTLFEPCKSDFGLRKRRIHWEQSVCTAF